MARQHIQYESHARYLRPPTCVNQARKGPNTDIKGFPTPPLTSLHCCAASIHLIVSSPNFKPGDIKAHYLRTVSKIYIYLLLWVACFWLCLPSPRPFWDAFYIFGFDSRGGVEWNGDDQFGHAGFNITCM